MICISRNRNATPSQILADLVIATGTHNSARNMSTPLNKLLCMHGRLFDASPFNYAIVEKDYVGVRNILVGVTNSGSE